MPWGSIPPSVTSSSEGECRRAYEAPGVAGFYARSRWEGSRHARRTNRREQGIVNGLLRHGTFDTVLDLACGSGRFQPLLRAHAGTVLACDQSRAMLREARAFRPDLAGFQASAFRIPLASGSVDLVLAMRLLQHYPKIWERRAILAEMARVSRRLVITSYFDRACFQALRPRRSRRPPARYAISGAAFRADVRAAGLVLRRRRFVLRGWSQQTLVLLERGETA